MSDTPAQHADTMSDTTAQHADTMSDTTAQHSMAPGTDLQHLLHHVVGILILSHHLKGALSVRAS